MVDIVRTTYKPICPTNLKKWSNSNTNVRPPCDIVQMCSAANLYQTLHEDRGWPTIFSPLDIFNWTMYLPKYKCKLRKLYGTLWGPRALGLRILRAAASHLMTWLTTLVTPKWSRRVDVMMRRWSLRLKCTEYRHNVSHIFHTSTGTALVGCNTHCVALTGPLRADHWAFWGAT